MLQSTDLRHCGSRSFLAAIHAIARSHFLANRSAAIIRDRADNAKRAGHWRDVCDCETASAEIAITHGQRAIARSHRQQALAAAMRANTASTDDRMLCRLENAAIDSRCTGDFIGAGFLAGCALARSDKSSGAAGDQFRTLAGYYGCLNKPFEATIVRRLGRRSIEAGNRTV
ncbi:hypothetical protein [Stratiformator vulcanicus]|uniref:Uncharacterized protein n=1 Tax=Stratiformator vulcanicus TaxID=2527980 RepID=A0A517R5R6_9PLAN|nr:hypothetical protein [Stratiformator vulcanicus]QDT39200.1 hypothetical protein Pan189_36030 [Stratiformator vulcanicus]